MPTFFANKNCAQTLGNISRINKWSDLVIKPAISASAFKTYKILNGDINAKEKLFEELVHQRDMLIQPYIKTIEEFVTHLDKQKKEVSNWVIDVDPINTS